MLARLSPRRRALVVGVVLLLLVGVTVVAVRIAVRAVRPDRAIPAQDRPGSVILVPGYGGGTGGLRVLAERIRSTGEPATVLQLPGDGTGDLREQARALDEAVSDALRGGAPSVDVIGYSAGGVTARLWAHDHDGTRKARRIITLGSPHRGAEIASAGQAFAPGACPPACRQLTPGSALLADLGGQVPDHPAWMSIWTNQDRTVTPPDSARLEGAINVPLQNVCPAARIDHSELPTDPAVTAIVLRALAPAPLQQPNPSSACTR